VKDGIEVTMTVCERNGRLHPRTRRALFDTGLAALEAMGKQTHIQEPGCPTPHRAFTKCGLTVATILLNSDRPTCPECQSFLPKEERREVQPQCL